VNLKGTQLELHGSTLPKLKFKKLKISTSFIIFDVDKLPKSYGDHKIQHFNGDMEIEN
jgi:hypothetical protein